MENEKIYVPSETEPYEINIDQTAREVIRLICQKKFGIYQPDEIYFKVMSVWISCKIKISSLSSSPSNNEEPKSFKLNLQLNDDNILRNVKDKVKSWYPNDGEFSFHLKRSAYFPIEDEENIEDEKLLEFLYWDAKDNVKNKIYSLKTRSFSRQNSLSESLKFFKWKDGNIRSFYRRESKDSGSSSDSDSEKPLKPKKMKEFLKKCRSIPGYGGFFFEGEMEGSLLKSIILSRHDGEKVFVAINNKGFHIINRDRQKISTLSFDKFDYKIKQFPQQHEYCLLINDNDNRELKQIFTYHAKFIERTLGLFQKNRKIIAESAC